MNNTFCLGIFLVLVYVQGLAWKFTAETISILFVEIVMFILVSSTKVQKLAHAFFVLSLYPISLLLVWFLENICQLD